MCDTQAEFALWQYGTMNDEPLLATLATSSYSQHRRLVRAATRLLGPADAEDAVQDAYVRALEADPLTLHSAQAWMLTVVRNLAIDRLRRRQLAVTHHPDMAQAAPSAESVTALAQEVSCALRLLATHLTPEDGAAILLHEVFEVSHADIAQASGRSQASSRQQLHRALLRLRHTRGVPVDSAHRDREPGEETLLRLYLQSLQLRDPGLLWAMLRHPPISAAAPSAMRPCAVPTSTPQTLINGVVQMGGQLGLALTLDGVRLCVVPLGVPTEHESETA